MSGLANSLRYLVAEPVRNASLPLFTFRATQILHERARGRVDAGLCRLARMFKPKLALPRSRLTDDIAITTTVATLERRGWDILPWRLSAGDLDEIKRFAFSTPAYSDDPTKPVTITPSHVPGDHGRYVWPISEFIRVPAVQRLVADSALHRVAQDYICCRPVLTSITLWLDPVYHGEYDAHVYHYDNDGPRFLKFFVYISDVDKDTGAHAYIQGSHSHIKPAKFHLSRRYDREALLTHYGSENEIVFEAPAGTILAEDTAGFHRGLDPRRDFRLLMQLVYGVIDIPSPEEYHGELLKSEIPALDPGIRRIARKFYF